MAEISHFGRLADGRAVRAVDLRAGDLTARLLDYGARIRRFRRGTGPNTAVSSDDLALHEGPLRYAGPVIAPVINRIAEAQAEIGGALCHFDANQDGRHCLHSGRKGAHTALWEIAATGPSEVIFALDLADGAGGFPGNRRITARYGLDEHGLTLEIEATTDRDTLMNPGSHGVWNTDGAATWQGLTLMVPAGTYLPVGPDLVPTGEIASVAGTRFDLRHPVRPAPNIDNNYCFEPAFGLRARLEGVSGALEIHSDAPGLQVYTGGQAGIALEPQLWPDAPHHPGFPPIDLRPGETFRQTSRYLLIPPG